MHKVLDTCKGDEPVCQLGLQATCPSKVDVYVVGDLDVFMSIHEGSQVVWA